MGFLKWFDNLPRWAKILISLIAGWRAYAIVDAIVNKKGLVLPIVLAVFAEIIAIVDLVLAIIKGKGLLID